MTAANADGPRDMMRFRIWVAGNLRCTHWVIPTDPMAAHQTRTISDHQSRIAAAADMAGEVWMAEVWDTGAPPERAYTRFGTDDRGMVTPIPFDADQLVAMLVPDQREGDTDGR